MKTKEELLKEIEDKTYHIFVECENCGTRREISIPVGTRVSSMPCEYCGCKELIKVNKIIF